MRWYEMIKRVLVSLGLAVGLLGSVSAAAFEIKDGDLRTIFYARSDVPVIWRYTPAKDVYVLDMPGLERLGRTFNRATQLVEQQYTEAYPRVLTSEELARYISNANRTFANFASGHDLRVSDLVQFFNLADRDKVELFPEEYALRDFLLGQGVMKEWRGFYNAQLPHAVILSIPQVQDRRSGEPAVSNHSRYAILLHELSHAEYHTNEAYKKYARMFWENGLTDAQREAFKKFLAAMRYSVENEDLVINEMQAYLMFTPDAGAFSAARLGVSETVLASMRESFLRGRPPVKLPLRAKAGELP
ncbi:MAG: hypothetical protein E6Q43_05090 [Dokdonella sp.]|nr:MAG: hypothetical protein E6Q43_05090 [Dokdonella sp.]